MIDDIINLYYERIFVYCRSRLNGNKSAAEDVTQEVFLTLYKKINRLKLGVNIRFWLYRTADFEIKTYIRKHPSFLSIDELSEENMLTEENFPSMSDSDFDCLSQEEYALIKDYYNSDDIKETAEKYNIKPSALYMRIHRIKKKILVEANKYHNLK